MNFKIVTDSSANILELQGVPFESVPLKIITSNKEYTDNTFLDVLGMVNDLNTYKGRSSTSCPNAEEWLASFGDAENVFCVTITGTLSGSYNAAITAKQLYEEAHPDRKVFVFNSLSTGPEMVLLIEKICEMALLDHTFEEICDELEAYAHKTGLLFMLESMKNLANNGRVSPLVAKMAGLLGIRVVGKASDVGDLQPLCKPRGEKNALAEIVDQLKSLGVTGGKLLIAHCFNEQAAHTLKDLLENAFEKIQVRIHACRGLCSFYAEKGGLLIGFERT